MPREISRQPGQFVMRDSVVIGLEPGTPRMREIAGELARTLQESGVAVRLAGGANAAAAITLRSAGGSDSTESYRLVIDPTGIMIDAPAAAGVLWGVQTLRQLIDARTGTIRLAAMTIDDAPLHSWRGTMLDVGRHLFPVEHILTHLDWMSRHKLNVFHWHLTEDQGWRIEIDAYPRLTEIGAFRKGEASPRSGEQARKPDQAGPRPYGGFYTKAQIRSVVERARILGITVVPEIEMPGHARAALAAYPHLGCTGDTLPVPTTWGVFTDVMCPGKESTFTFIETVLTEVLELFPSRYIHIGGDEVPKERWKNCASCQEIIRQEELGDEHGLQRWMIARVGQWLAEHDRKLIGWDEIIDGGLPTGATVQAWQGSERITAAMSLGADVIASPSEWLYLNRQANELPLGRVATFDPAAYASSRPGAGGRLLGIEAPLWTEHVTSAVNAEIMWWPRLLAVAEVAWHGKPDSAEFMVRAYAGATRLRDAGVAVGPADRGLLQLRFDYDSATRTLRAVHQAGMPELQLVMVRPDSIVVPLASGAALPGAGIWQLSAMWRDESVGESRTVIMQPHLAMGRPITVRTEADPRYPGTGAFNLVDGARGASFNDGFWNGWWGPDLEATIDLERLQSVTSVELSLLEEVNSWIVYPDSVELHHSSDGSSWQVLQRKALDLPLVPDASSRQLVAFDIPTGFRTRWVRVIAKGGKRLPSWHPGAGQLTWIFADEILVR